MKTLRPVVVYVIVAYLISWIVFILLALNHHQVIYLFRDDAAHTHMQDIGHSLGALGPFIAAIITIKFFYQKETWRQFISSYSRRKLNARAWLFTLSPLFIFVFSMMINRIINHDWFNITGYFRNNKLNDPANFFTWLLPLLLYGFSEEAGWRGYMLSALQSKYSAFKATIILSCVWACWHIPSFFYRFNISGLASLGFLLGIFAGAIWLTFLFNYTNGSILAVSLWHFTFNLVSVIGKDDIILSAMMSATAMLLAAFVLTIYKLEDLSPVKRTKLPAAIAKLKVPISSVGMRNTANILIK